MAEPRAPEELRIRYVPLDTLVRWDANPKRHDLPQLIALIRRYGFKDPPRWEPALNGGAGGIVEGNGRTDALSAMKAAGEEPPRGIARTSEGAWYVPVVFGVDAESSAAAEAYGLDHNNSTLGGSGLDPVVLWYQEAYASRVAALEQAGERPGTLSDSMVAELLSAPPAATPPESFQAFDEHTIEDEYCCPKCGYGWRGKPK
jgi:hypothetical protein